jgi:hypothetical protein
MIFQLFLGEREMKQVLIIFVLIYTSSIFGGSFGYTPDINTYDPESGFYYKSLDIENTNRGFLGSGSRTKIINIIIYNPITEKQVKLFKANDENRNIEFVMFESSIKNGIVEAYSSYGLSHIFKNNIVKENRRLRDKLLIGVSNLRNKSTVLWVSKKNGDDLKKITEVLKFSTWHIDLKNSKLRVVTSIKDRLKLQNFDW